MTQAVTRWRSAVSAANDLALQERWYTLTRQWAAAVSEYRELYHAEVPDVARLRRVCRRVYDLDQQRLVIRHALAAPAAGDV